MKIHEKFYFILLFILYGLDIILILGLFTFDTTVILYLTMINKFFISIYLMYKTNPFINVSLKFNKFDRRLVFSSAFYLLISAFALAKIDVKKKVENEFSKVVGNYGLS